MVPEVYVQGNRQRNPIALFMNKERGHGAFSMGSLKLLGDAASFLS